jgi:hypothetical protein
MDWAAAYVMLSRGRERGMVFTDLPREELLDAMRQSDRRKSATELMGPAPGRETARAKVLDFIRRMQKHYRPLREGHAPQGRGPEPEPPAPPPQGTWQQRYAQREQHGHAR